MLLLTYDPNVKPTVPFPVPVVPKRNYLIGLVSPYSNPAKIRKLQEQVEFTARMAFASLVPMTKEARDEFNKEAKRLGLPGLVRES